MRAQWVLLNKNIGIFLLGLHQMVHLIITVYAVGFTFRKILTV